jgi:branched-chain amino acid aminotransferase
VKPADRYLFVVFSFPFGNYYATPVDVLVTDKYVRAFPGGTGDVKPAGNYAPALLADREAQQAGFQTVLWLDGVDRKYVEECGVMNVFFVFKDGRVITPSLTGTILPGVTRDSVLTLVRDIGLPVEERRISIDELFDASDRGEVSECFGTGTAATLSHIRSIRLGDRVITLPAVEDRRVGPAVRDRLVRIATGVLPDPHGWMEVIARQQTNATA